MCPFVVQESYLRNTYICHHACIHTVHTYIHTYVMYTCIHTYLLTYLLTFICCSNCTEIETGGWYSPYVLNQAAIKKISAGTGKYGMAETCTEFDVSQVPNVCMYVCMHLLWKCM